MKFLKFLSALLLRMGIVFGAIGLLAFSVWGILYLILY